MGVVAGRSQGGWAGRVLVTFCFLVWLLVTQARAVCEHSSSCALRTFYIYLYTAIKFTLKQLYGVLLRMWELSIKSTLKKKKYLGLGALEMGAHLWADQLPREGSAACRACRSAAEGPVEDSGGAGQRPTEPQGPSPGAAGQEVPGVQSPDEPRDSVSSSANDTPRA